MSKRSKRNVQVQCPKCRRKSWQHDMGHYWCEYCRMAFDGDPDEGGDWSDRNPAARIMREERRKKGAKH